MTQPAKWPAGEPRVVVGSLKRPNGEIRPVYRLESDTDQTGPVFYDQPIFEQVGSFKAPDGSVKAIMRLGGGDEGPLAYEIVQEPIKIEPIERRPLKVFDSALLQRRALVQAEEDEAVFRALDALGNEAI